MYSPDNRENRNQMTKHSPNKDKNRCQHVELHSPEIKIHQGQCKSKINNNQANMSPQKSSKLTTVSLKNCNISKYKTKTIK